MRILFDSKNSEYKKPFGAIKNNERCYIKIKIPSSCETYNVNIVFLCEDEREYCKKQMSFSFVENGYDIYECDFEFCESGLYFYYFLIETKNSAFRLFKYEYDDTNIEDGKLWQLTVYPDDYTVPKGFYGRVMYQIFPDRFNSVGRLSLEGKIEPYTLHENKYDIPDYKKYEDYRLYNSDFYGGNLPGITEKLDYLSSLGVGVIYLNPIFKAKSNHRYDTADYKRIDEMLGDEEDFVKLCTEAHKRDIKIILDGVFSHTGSDSIYFDAEHKYSGGACEGESSEYYGWYNFRHFPDDYEAWWGVKSLPCVNECSKYFTDYIIDLPDSVIAHWIKAGADGFRLDVADELPDEFIVRLRNRLKELNPDALLIGEVWEDATTKISYGKRRGYFTNGELDSVMNYPFRNALLDFTLGIDNGSMLRNTVMTLCENYPSEALPVLMNMVSTHDTPRILSALGVDPGFDKEKRAGFKMQGKDLCLAVKKLKMIFFLQFVLPGMPCIYYGDEIGTEGFEDPFCRGYFDWSRVENNEILHFLHKLTDMRKIDALALGGINIETNNDGMICIIREYNGEHYRAYASNANGKQMNGVTLNEYEYLLVKE